MRFTETSLAGAYIVELIPFADERGFFSRAFCAEEFHARGLVATVAQSNLSFNPLRGTVRGLHYLLPPAREAKLIRCTRGAICDVLVDVRPDSPTYLQHLTVELTADNRKAIYVPPNVAHGYQSLVDDTEIFYQVGDTYVSGLERGVRFDDPLIGINWPLPVSSISEKDRSWPLLKRSRVELLLGPAISNSSEVAHIGVEDAR